MTSNESSSNPVIAGLDIGGANLKLAWRCGERTGALSKYFAMWKEHEGLISTITELLGSLDARPTALGVTMTAELADCFYSRDEGVDVILQAVKKAREDIPTWVYSVGGDWYELENALASLPEMTWDFAASNWHGLASWLTQTPPLAKRQGVIVDFGSTTVDVIPFSQGRVATRARTDHDRLLAKQLVYTGLERTPVCAIVRSVSVGGVDCPVMAERFAESQDAQLLLGEIPAEESCRDTADGRPRLPIFAAARLARMIGEDASRLKEGQLRGMAEQIVQTQVNQVIEAIDANLSRFEEQEPPLICFCGHANATFERIKNKLQVTADYMHLSDVVGEAETRSAPAFAMVELIGRRFENLGSS